MRTLLLALTKLRPLVGLVTGRFENRGIWAPPVVLHYDPAQLGGPPTVTYVDAFLRLTVVPQITSEGTIFLNVMWKTRRLTSAVQCRATRR